MPARRELRFWRACAGFFILVGAVQSCKTSDHGDDGSVPRWELEPTLRIDGNAADLVPVGFLLVSRAGVLAVGQPQDHSIRFFDSQGGSIGTVGRAGSGPGEFGDLGGAGWIGDSLWTYDYQLRRVTILSPSRSVARTLVLGSIDPQRSRGLGAASLSLNRPLAVYPDGSMLVAATPASVSGVRADGPTPGEWLLRVSFSDSFDGNIQAVVVRLPDDDGSYIKWVNPTTMVGAGVPFHARAMYAVAPEGESVAIVTTSLANAPNVVVHVTVLSQAGDTIAARRIPFVGQRIPRRTADSAIAARAARATNPVSRELYNTVIRERVPTVYAPVTQVRFGRDGTIWLGLRPSGNARHWLVLDNHANPVGEVLLPRSVAITVCDRRSVWGVESDPYGIPSIVGFEVVRSSQ